MTDSASDNACYGNYEISFFRPFRFFNLNIRYFRRYLQIIRIQRNSSDSGIRQQIRTVIIILLQWILKFDYPANYQRAKKTGYIFTPASKSYTNLTANQTGDYSGTQGYTISGL